jgi:hypothetical protein
MMDEMSEQDTRRFLTGAALVAALTLVHLLYYLPRTVDDMFIFLRYAEQWASGHGLVYNVGQRVEGHSSPAWMLLLMAGELVGQGGVGWAKALGFGALIALQLGLYKLGREQLGLTPALALITPAFIAMNSNVIAWSTWGLETPLYLALLVLAGLTLGRVMHPELATRRRHIIAGVICAGCALARPEAPLMLAAMAAGLIMTPLDVRAGLARLKAALPATAIASAAFGAYLVGRRLYYGVWMPHTYYAKRGDERWRFEHLAALWEQGASAPEVIMALGGLALALWLAATRRFSSPLLLCAAILFFVGRVIVDWMPNQRHMLPLWLMMPLVWAAAIQHALLRARDAAGAARGLWLGAALAGVLVVAGAAVELVRTDSRYSPMDHKTHGRGVEWRRMKTLERAEDALIALSGGAPKHVAAMGPYNHGMITQLYRLIEADSRPLDQVWYLGRDIGRVGYYAPVNVFDTDGLFTPAVVKDAQWRAGLGPSPALIDEAFALPVVMTELPDVWPQAVMHSPHAARFEPVGGHVWLRPRDAERPDPATILARYKAAQAKLPTTFTLMTLYGEAVGAALVRRVRTVERAVQDISQPPAALPAELTGGPALLDGALTFLGCAAPATARAGTSVEVVCALRAERPVTRRYDVFVHVEGPHGRSSADHPPVAGLLPTTAWTPGTLVLDRFEVHLPKPGEVTLKVGLYDGGWRAKTPAGPHVERDGRLIGPRITVTP